MIKAAFFDIDGTLISFNTHLIPDSTINAIKELRQQGIKIFIATGRPLSLISLPKDIIIDGIITLNGAFCISSDKKIIYKTSIPKEDINAIIRNQEETEHFPCQFTTQDNTAINFVNQQVIDLCKLINVPIPQIKPLEDIAKKDILQINIYVDKQKEEELQKTVFTHCEASRWNPHFADVNVKGIDKSTGIKHILEYYQIDVKETISFGDGGNDIPMLKYTHIGIAMGNASDEVKQAASYITDTVDNEGIAKALKHFSLIQ